MLSPLPVRPDAERRGLSADRLPLRQAGGVPLPCPILQGATQASIGEHKAVIQAGRIQLTGFVAWLPWLFVHILYLVGVKDRIAMFLFWSPIYAFSRNAVPG